MVIATLHNYMAAKHRAPALSGLSLRERQIYESIPAWVEYMDHPSFSSPDAEEVLFGDKADEIDVPNWTDFPEVAEEVPGTRAGRVSLSAQDESLLFLRYNYARYRLSILVAGQKRRPSLPRARQMVTWYKRAMEARSDLVRANMALVPAMAKRIKIPNVEFSELVSEGNMALLRSVEKFDVSRGFKFSTYACRAILKSFNRLATKTGRYHQHFPTQYDPELETSDYDIRRHDDQRTDSIEAVREILARNRANLSDVERTIVMERFAIATRGRGRTLADVGKMVGLTSERVRQVQNLALDKIRSVLDEEYLTV